MATDESLDLALRLLQDDLEELEDRQKGKHAAGELDDPELSIATMKESILALQTSIQDHALAVSTSTAIVSDQNILQSNRQEERMAEQDHEHATALGYDKDHVPLDANEHLCHGDSVNETISMVLGDLMGQMALTDEPDNDNGDGSSRRVVPSSQARAPCISCFELFDRMDLLVNSCGETMCHECARELFLGSVRDEELYPPRCCGRVIPPGIALRLLDYRELYEFSQRSLEYSAKDRMYCAELTCSKFIPPFAIEGEHGTCPECRRQTHLLCRSLAHPQVGCPFDQPLQDMLALAEEESWRRCFNCRAMVELHHGCHHITCRCGREFCYVCGLEWESCDCELWQEKPALRYCQRGS